ncbi:MAG: hypothetical protein AAGE43_06070 [Pseudomonadota bacterium]
MSNEEGVSSSGDEATAGNDTEVVAPKRKAPLWQRALPWLITIACFAYLYNRIASQTPEGMTVIGYLADVFASVNWIAWLGLMIPYSFLYLLIDTAVLWRVIRWFNADDIAYKDLLPVRASTYIISILNEQVGKGAMAVYLNRREGVPGWEVASSMLFIMFCEFFYLLSWALIGVTVSWEIVPEIFHNIPYIALGAAIFLAAFIFFFRSDRFDAVGFRQKPLLKSFRNAKWHYYLTIMVLRSPALVGAVWVYSVAAGLFGVEIPFIQMIGVLPLIFFGTLIPGPFRAFAVALWPTLFPDYVAEMAIFGFVQHNFFLLFNAGIGLLFLRRANRELFSGEAAPQKA